MKQSLTLKTTKLLLPILIGIFVVGGILISLPLLKNNVSNTDVGYELNEGNAVDTLSIVAKTNFVLPILPIHFEDTQHDETKSVVNIKGYKTFISKDIFRNILIARAP